MVPVSSQPSAMVDGDYLLALGRGDSGITRRPPAGRTHSEVQAQNDVWKKLLGMAYLQNSPLLISDSCNAHTYSQEVLITPTVKI